MQLIVKAANLSQVEFLLTHPLRGATCSYTDGYTVNFISTHTPLAGCNKNLELNKYNNFISTHTPLAGCNILWHQNLVVLTHFYSHTPCGVQLICIHYNYTPYDFYSHTPCGVQLSIYG